MLPDNGDIVYPDTLFTVYEYVPLSSENTILEAFIDSVLPLSVTDHDVPDDNPVSVNITLYPCNIKEIPKNLLAPFIFTCPDMFL